jgi:NADPH2:quinone reductase
MTTPQTPKEMTAVVLDAYSGVEALRVQKRPVPKPGPNQVLVKVAASPINPSDLAFLEGSYDFKKETPVVPGFEGSGTVVVVGSGMMGRYLMGKRVACINQKDGDGVWAEYMVTDTTLALPLASSVSMEQGAMSAVNPLTAMAFLDIAKKGGHKAIVQTAAASALGQMVNRIFENAGIRVINIVRRDAQVEFLKQAGAEIVLNSTNTDFSKELKEICKEHKVHLAFDAVAGELTMQVLNAMPRNSKVTVYGGLSFAAAQADPGDLIFKGKSVDGFWLTSWLREKNPLQSLLLWQRAQKLLASDLKSDVRARYSFADVQTAVSEYQDQMTGGKTLLVPEE